MYSENAKKQVDLKTHARKISYVIVKDWIRIVKLI